MTIVTHIAADHKENRMTLSAVEQLYQATRQVLETRLTDAEDHIQNYQRMLTEYITTIDTRAAEDKQAIVKMFTFLTGLQEEVITDLKTKLGMPQEKS